MGLATTQFTDRQRLALGELSKRRSDLNNAQNLALNELLKRSQPSIAPKAVLPETQQVAETPSQMDLFDVPDFLKQTVPTRRPGTAFAAPVSTAVEPRIKSPEDFFAGQDLPQQQLGAREGPIEVTSEERMRQFAQESADVITGDIKRLIQAQVPKTPESKPILKRGPGRGVPFRLADVPPSELLKRFGTKADVFGKAVIHGIFPLIAQKIPIAQKERENLEEKFPITFKAGEVAGEIIPIVSSFKATQFVMKPLILTLAVALANSPASKRLAIKTGLKLTQGSLAGMLFEVLSGRKPTVETAATFAVFEAAIPGSQKVFDVAIKDVLKARTKAELQAVTSKLNTELTGLRRIAGKSQLKSIEQRSAGLEELAKASKAERGITLQAETVKRGRNELRKAKAEFDKLKEQTVLTKEGKNVTARVQNILENLKKDKSLRQSKIGRDLLRQTLKLQESIGNLQKQARPKVEVVSKIKKTKKSRIAELRKKFGPTQFAPKIEVVARKGKPPVVTGEKLPKAEARTLAEVESFGRTNKFLTAEQKIEPTKTGILDKAISDFAEGKIKQGELVAKFNDAVVKKVEKVAEKLPVAEKVGELEPIERQRGALTEVPERVSIHIAPGNRRQIVVMSDQGVQIPLLSVGERDPNGTKKLVKAVSDFLNSPESQAKAKKVFGSEPTFKKAVAEKREIGAKQFIDLFFPKKPTTKILVIPKTPKPKEVPRGQAKKTAQAKAVPEVTDEALLAKIKKTRAQEEAAELEARKPRARGFFKGDKIEYTGKEEKLHGGKFFEFKYLTGPKTGETGLTAIPPKPFKRPKPTPVKGGKPQEQLPLGVQATVPSGKIKTVQGKQEGLFAPPKPKGKQLKVSFEGDPLDEILNAGIKLRSEDRVKGALSEEMKALQSQFKNKRIFNQAGQTLDEHAANLGISEEKLRQQLLRHDPSTVRVRKSKEKEAFFLENKKAGIEAEKEFKKAGEPHINEKGELVVGNKVLFQASGGLAGLETDDEGKPTFNAKKSLAGLLATSVGVNVLRSHRMRRLGTNLVEKIQNSQLRVRQLQELKGVKLQGKGLDPYETEIRYHGRIDNRLRKVKKVAEEIDKGIAKVEKNFAKNFPAFQNRDFQQDTFLYLISKHAPEYNATLGKNAAGITTREAEKTLAKLRTLPYFGEIKRTASQIKKLSDATLDILADGQIISQKVKDDLRKRWPEYISFQRILENVDDTQLMQILSGGKGISTIGTGLKKAKGSQLEISDVLTNTVANVEQAFVRAEKNIVALSTLEFARNNPQLGLFRELKFGKVKAAKRVEQPTLPLKNVLPFESIPVVDVSAITGKPIFNTQKLFKDKNILGIRENGKQVFLRILDPSLSAALKMTGQESLGFVTRAVGAFTRYVTATATRFNPAFQIPNILRDSQEMAAYMMAQKEFGVGGALGAIKSIPKSMSDIYDAVFLGKNTPGARLYKQMQAEGSTTGGLSLSTRKNLEIDITKIRKANRSHPRKVVKEVVKFFDNYNALFEDATRLSVYKESLARGLTRKEAAVFAKEATINFNRRGTVGAHMNAWYAFANASIQGSTKMIRAMRKSPKAVAAVTSAVLAGTWGQNQWNDMIDPDWRDKVPQWERNNNLVILMPGAKKGRYERMLIPVSWGIKPIKTLADYAVDLAQGHNRGSKLDIVTGIAGSTLDAYNPVGGSNLRQAVTPTILDVPGDIASNETWFGKPIKPNSPYFPNLSEHNKFFRSSGDTKFGRFTINAARYLNDQFSVSVSPESMKYTIEQYSGGTGRFLTRSYDTILNIGSGKAQDINEVPVVRRFFKSTPEDVIERWKKSRKLNDPSLKKLQEESDNQIWERSVSVRDAFEQIKESKNKDEMRQIAKDLINKDPKAYKNLLKRIKDDKKGIDYYDSVLKDLQPNFRAERVMIELERAKDKKARLAELIRAKIIDKETAFHLKRLGFKKPE